MLVETFISLVCSAGVYQQACQKAIEAGTKQTGVYQNVEKTESYVTNKSINVVQSVTGEKPLAVIGIAAKIYREKAVSYGFNPHVLRIDHVGATVGFDGKMTVGVRWSF